MPNLYGFSFDDYFFIQKGDLPIILTAPHGGTLPIPETPERKTGEKICDLKTLELVQVISDNLYKITGLKPYILGAKFSRKYIDANRSKKNAFDQKDSQIISALYENYHKILKSLIDEMRARFSYGALLIDIHGQSHNKDCIYIGTKNGETVKQLIERHGIDSMYGSHSIALSIETAGYLVFPSCNQGGNSFEEKQFNGGFTVQSYSSHIDALQLEIGLNMRSPLENRTKFATNLARAIANFYQTYL